MIGFATIVVDQECDNCGWSCNNCIFFMTIVIEFATIVVDVATFGNIATIVITVTVPLARKGQKQRNTKSSLVIAIETSYE